MKSIIVFFVLVIGVMIYFHHSLQNGSVLKYIDVHSQARYVPETAYYLGEGYYLFQNLQEAATYYLRVAQRYPKHELADDAYFGYIQCMDDMVSVSRSDLVEGYKAYLEKYPRGKHAELAKNRLDSYLTGGQ